MKIRNLTQVILITWVSSFVANTLAGKSDIPIKDSDRLKGRPVRVVLPKQFTTDSDLLYLALLIKSGETADSWIATLSFGPIVNQSRIKNYHDWVAENLAGEKHKYPGILGDKMIIEVLSRVAKGYLGTVTKTLLPDENCSISNAEFHSPKYLTNVRYSEAKV